MLSSVRSRGDKTPALNDFLQNNRGSTGLAQRFQSGGSGEVFSSWIGSGGNQAITAETINQVLGSSQVQAFAQKLGIDPAQASDFIAKNLPQVIDTLTPEEKGPACVGFRPLRSWSRWGLMTGGPVGQPLQGADPDGHRA